MNSVNKSFNNIIVFTFLALCGFALERSLILLSVLDISIYDYSEIALLYFMGLRFDLKIIFTFLAIFYIIPISISLMIFNNHKKVIRIFNYPLLLIFLFFIFMSFVNYGFYHYFGTHIDVVIFGLIDDGFMAVFNAMMFNINISILVFIFFILLFFIILLFIYFMQKDIEIYNSSRFYIAVFFIIMIFVVYILAPGGGSGKFSLSRKVNNANKDAIINELAINSVMYLYYANKDLKSSNFNISSKNILDSLNVSSLQELKRLAGFNSKNTLIKNTDTLNTDTPNIVFVFLEGWSSHIALKHSDTNNVLGEFNIHKNQDYFNPLHFSNENSTSSSLERLLINSPVGPLSISKAKNTSFSTSNPLVFKKYGYENIFISGGHRAWRMIGDFYLKQGFDEFYDRVNIESYVNRVSNHYWGAYDGDLFVFLKYKMSNSTKKPFFYFALTTNNHDDVVLPDDFKAQEFDLSVYGKKQSNHSQQVLNGYMYSVDAFGKFLTWLKASRFAENTIVVATGDHVRRGFKPYLSSKEMYYKYSTPLYLYIPSKYRQLHNQLLPSSHIDIFPTLFDLSLSNQEYFSFGRSLLKAHKPYGYNVDSNFKILFSNGVMSDNGMYEFKDGKRTLNATSKELSKYQKTLLKQIRYKEELAKYIIFKNYENQKTLR